MCWISGETEMLAQTSACKVCEMLAYAVVSDVASKNKQDEEQLNAHEVLHGTITLLMF